uniref:Dual oxidase maturation factor 1 n=1 Tax=Leptobrachium leishanense TaxID=445787 RepID=A0A8C5LZV8_9ANUR
MPFTSFPFYLRPRTPFIYDRTIVEIIILCIVATCTFIIILPGIRGKFRFFWLLRVLTSLVIGAVILAVNFTRDWEVGSVITTTAYKSFSNVMVNVSIGVWVGLKGVNITLSGIPVQQINETIDYNEIFHWQTERHFDKDYEEGRERGLPNPILYVAEKFTSVNPCQVLQQYRIATYYTSAIMWFAFCTWVVSSILFSMLLIQYGIYMMFATTLCIIMSVATFASNRNGTCSINFGTHILQLKYGASYWMSCGAVCSCALHGKSRRAADHRADQPPEKADTS